MVQSQLTFFAYLFAGVIVQNTTHRLDAVTEQVRRYFTRVNERLKKAMEQEEGEGNNGGQNDVQSDNDSDD